MGDSQIKSFLIVVVSLAWLFNLVAPSFIPAYTSNLAVNGPFLLILGSLFATRTKGDKDA